jgi:23S rRNA (guanine2445-N2)-methyltransferase / 23S rRNA (guanine2069-N7)-methyltransferase
MSTAPTPLDPAAARAAGGDAFENRLRKNLAHLAKWARREGVTCYRAYDADLPEFAVAVDVYEARWAVVQEYAPPASVDPAKAARRLGAVLALVPEVLGIAPADLFLKVRERGKGGEKYGATGSGGERHQVREGAARLLVNFTDHVDTGLFLDHRPARFWIQENSAGRRFLNLFAYTGAATVHAALGGAATTTTVDLSRTYLDWAAANLRANGFEPGPAHRLKQADCLAWLRDDDAQHDLIFMDPPVFSNSKRMDGVLDVQRDHTWMIDAAMRRLAPGGVLLFSNNLRSFVLDPALAERYAVRDWTRASIAPDFARDLKIHHAYFIRHRDAEDHRG